MSAGHPGQADHRVAMDADEASGLADAAALVEVLEHGAGRALRQVGVEERRALALGESGLAGVAVEQADVVALAVASADREVAGGAPAEEGAVGVLAAEACEVIHGFGASRDMGRGAGLKYERYASLILRQNSMWCSITPGHHPSKKTR